MQRASQAIRDVRKMDQDDGWDCLFEWRVQIRLLAGADGVDEVRPVVNAFIPAFFAARMWTRLLFFSEEYLISLGRAQISFRAVDNIADSGVCTGGGTRHLVGYRKNVSLAVRNPMPHFKHQNFARTLVELERCDHRVGRLLVVIEHKMTASCRDLGWILDAEQPSRGIHLVNTLVADISIAVIPEPVEIVVESIAGEGMLGSGSKPKVIVNAGRDGLDGSVTDGIAPLIAKAA